MMSFEQLKSKIEELIQVDRERRFLEEYSRILRAEILELMRNAGLKQIAIEKGMAEIRRKAIERMSPEAKAMMEALKERLKSEGKITRDNIEYLALKIFEERR